MGKKIPEKLYKTTIVVWTEYKADDAASSDPDGDALVSIAHDACHGEAYCSKFDCVEVVDPERDPDWDGTEFFGEQAEPKERGPFDCPGCGVRGTPEETRDGMYLMRCKEPEASCSYDDVWLVPVEKDVLPARPDVLPYGQSFDDGDDDADEALGMLQSEGRAAIRQVDAGPFLMEAFVNARPIEDEGDNDDGEDSDFAAWCRSRGVGTDSRDAWHEWKAAQARLAELRSELEAKMAVLRANGGRGIELAEEIDDIERMITNLEAGRDEDEDGDEDRMFEFGVFAVGWEWIGEGRSGDYDEDDPGDAKMLRATLYVRPEVSGAGDMEWEPVEDGSYCTLAQVGTPVERLKAMSLDLVNENGGPEALDPLGSFSKHQTEMWTWRTLWPDEDKGEPPPGAGDCPNSPCDCGSKS